MRTAFIETLCEVAAADERVWLLTGDLGYSVLERFAEQFPDRYVNVGVAEQNMTGVAAGLAHMGNIVFTYSIANFPTLRCLEQIRNDACYHELPVKIVSVGGGFAYGTQGYTHHGLEDLSIMKSLPNMTVVAPGDPIETRRAVEALVAADGPAYLRLGKAGEPTLNADDMPFELGKAHQVRQGRDVTLISTGGMLATTMATADKLEVEHGLDCRVLSMHTLKPLDTDAIMRALKETSGIVTVEEHNVNGGLGSAVADVVACHDGPRGFFRKFGVPDRLIKRIGSQESLRSEAGNLYDLLLTLQIRVAA